jgi:hypothetical protein
VQGSANAGEEGNETDVQSFLDAPSSGGCGFKGIFGVSI